MDKSFLIKLLNKRGFNLEKEIDWESGDKSYFFINQSEMDKYYENVIVLEVFDGGGYHFYYKQTGMLGYMDSGDLGKLDSEQFEWNYKRFVNQVNCLRNGIKK